MQAEVSADEYISPSNWGKDHWSTLAYIDTICVEKAGAMVAPDPKMRCNNRRHRHLIPRVWGGWEDKYSSSLRDGSIAVGHDDWDCVQDLVEFGFLKCVCHPLPEALQDSIQVNRDLSAARVELLNAISMGLIEKDDTSVQPGKIMHLTSLGQQAISLLRTHKSIGGSFSDFTLPEWAMPIESPTI